MPSWVSLFASSSARGSRSTVLQALLWLDALTVAATIGAATAAAPALATMFGVAFGISFITTIGAFAYLLFTDRDALRSESFSIEKLRLEKELRGDSLSGFREIGPAEEPSRQLAEKN